MPRIGVTSYSRDTKLAALALIKGMRPIIKLVENESAGQRFNNDERILWNLESSATEDQFLLEPYDTTYAAFVEAAKADYWYSHEKDWGNDDDDIDDDSSYDVEE